MRGAVSPPKALNAKDSGSLNKYLGLKAFNPIAAEILNEGRNSLLFRSGEGEEVQFPHPI